MKEFVKSIFDLSFSKFISINVIRVFFVIGALILGGVCLTVAVESIKEALSYEGTNPPSALFGPAWVLICLFWFGAGMICWRIIVEAYVALIRIAENTTKLVEMKESKEG